MQKSTSGPRLSAKQRREMKKAKKQGQQVQLPTQTECEEEEKSWLPEDNQGRGRNKGKKADKKHQETQQQPKRGQKVNYFISFKC